MTDFVRQALSGEPDPPFRNALDVDFYKYTMGQAIFVNWPDDVVEFSLIVRDPLINISEVIPAHELVECLNYARSVAMTPTNLAYLRGMRVYGVNMFREDYTSFLENYRLPEFTLETSGGAYRLTFRGRWVEVSMWETIALAIISQLYYKNLMRKMPRHEVEILYARAKAIFYNKLERIAEVPGIFLADFCQRRRHSFLWQEWCVGMAKRVLGKQFTGTSNTWMAFHHDLTPIGTNAHELPMERTAVLDGDPRAQYEVLERWQELYGQGLRIFLPDTYGTEQFLAGAPDWVADWRGMRQDSGDPVTRGELYITWLLERGRDPLEKVIIFSDGLDVDEMIRLEAHFRGRIKTAFGWGTLFGNDFRGCHKNPLFRPFSMVCKITMANGKPVVKLPDNILKATGLESAIARYMRNFGREGRIEQKVVV